VSTRPAGDPTVNYKDVVRAGYDLCAGAYAAARGRDDSDQLAPLLALLPDGSSVLDLGCGTGVPIARKLAERHRVTGIDLSAEMVRMARLAVPEARITRGDISDAQFDGGSYDAVVAMYVLFHLPREQHGGVLRSAWQWLRPGGYLLATLSETAEAPYTEDDFFGVKMYWSSLGWGEYEGLLRGIGFEILGHRIIGHGYGRVPEARDERHPMVLAQRLA